jgi:hypothetical protein
MESGRHENLFWPAAPLWHGTQAGGGDRRDTPDGLKDLMETSSSEEMRMVTGGDNAENSEGDDADDNKSKTPSLKKKPASAKSKSKTTSKAAAKGQMKKPACKEDAQMASQHAETWVQRVQ